MITIFNLATQERKDYSCTPRQAVIAAFAQEKGDFNTWQYEERYGTRVQEGKHTFLCGDWSALKASDELKPGHTDLDSLPPFDVLDEILRLYVEENMSARDIIAHGFEEKTVRWVQRRVDINEYKREQAAPGIKVTSRAFGVGRRMPIAQKYVD